MAVTTSEENVSNLHKGLCEWWSEETEYVLQRIERWAAFARGYNRLRSQRLSRGRMTMQEVREQGWTISANRLVVEDPPWNPSFRGFKRSHRRKSQSEEMKINCCGTFNYQSNSNLDSNCLETYRYDHSIYFKTIGEIRSGKRDVVEETQDQQDRISVSSDEQVEWEAVNATSLPEVENNNVERNVERAAGVWPIVDLRKFDAEFNSEMESYEDNNNSYDGNYDAEISNDGNYDEEISNNGNSNSTTAKMSLFSL